MVIVGVVSKKVVFLSFWNVVSKVGGFLREGIVELFAHSTFVEIILWLKKSKISE